MYTVRYINFKSWSWNGEDPCPTWLHVVKLVNASNGVYEVII